MKNKLLTFVLGCIPGVGHLYLGHMKRGIQLLTLFFGAIFLMNLLRISELFILLPIIWFYSLFDALQQHSLMEEGVNEDRALFPIDSKLWNPRWIAYALIGVGIYLIIDNAFQGIRRHFEFLWAFNLDVILLSILFIFIGFKMLAKLKKKGTVELKKAAEADLEQLAAEDEGGKASE